MPPTSKDDFLKTVREALGRAEGATPPDYAPLKLRAEDQRQKVVTIEARARARRPLLLARLADMAERQGWRVCRAASPQDAVAYVAALAREKGARTAVRTAHEVFRRVPLDAALRGHGVAVTEVVQGPEASRQALREAMASADLGVTGVDYAVAETGTVAFVARRGVSRVASLLPPVHVALVEAHQVYETQDDLWALRRMAFLEGDMGSYLSLTSGPSRTADIEQRLVVGVHGPIEAHLVVLEG